MLNATTLYKICLGLLGAISVRGRGDCWVTPDACGVVFIPDGTETIPKLAFYACDEVKAVIIPASVRNVGFAAFYDAQNLEKVIFEAGSLLEVIGDQAFFYTFKLKAITLPANVKEIGESAFACGNDLKKIGGSLFHSGLEKMIFEEGSHLEVIGRSAFNSCKALQAVTLPPTVKQIRAWAFFAAGLLDVIFEGGSVLETIGKEAFYGNDDLKSINIPPGIVIDHWAFESTGCPEDIFTPGATIVDCTYLAETKGLRGNELVSSE